MHKFFNKTLEDREYYLYDDSDECWKFIYKREIAEHKRLIDSIEKRMTKRLSKPKVERFDPKTLEPYDRVLVRDATSRCWKIDFYGYNPDPYVGLIDCASGSKPYCIPYNEETKHLLGTTDDCPEHYKWWEE